MAVLGLAIVTLVAKLWIAATTFGTNDIVHWLSFLHTVEKVGPIRVYGVSMPYHSDGHVIQLYNHPPLIGYFLVAVHAATHIGFTPQFTIRASSSLADVGSALLIFELLRTRVGLGRALTAGLIVAVSPILIVISGFHGNTDPILIMFALLSAYLLADRDRPLLAGVALAISIGVKIVPVIVVPCLLVYALSRGARVLVRFVIGAAATSALFWGPALVLEGPQVKRDVLGYAGLNSHEWGIDLLAKYAKDPGAATWLEGPGRLIIVAVCSLIPAILVWRRPTSVVSGVALALCAFLALAPSFGPQYFAWVAGPIFLLSIPGGITFTVLASGLLEHVYTRWNGGFPWDHAHATPFTPREQVLGLFVWASLCAVVMIAARRMFLLERDEKPDVEPIEPRTAPQPV